MRENEPYNLKELVTEEEVRIATETSRWNGSWEVNRVELILRMWGEIQNLRSMIMKQKY